VAFPTLISTSFESTALCDNTGERALGAVEGAFGNELNPSVTCEDFVGISVGASGKSANVVAFDIVSFPSRDPATDDAWSPTESVPSSVICGLGDRLSPMEAAASCASEKLDSRREAGRILCGETESRELSSSKSRNASRFRMGDFDADPFDDVEPAVK
jgi:hypothetical protein